jgi:hypothetical protein
MENVFTLQNDLMKKVTYMNLGEKVVRPNPQDVLKFPKGLVDFSASTLIRSKVNHD